MEVPEHVALHRHGQPVSHELASALKSTGHDRNPGLLCH